MLLGELSERGDVKKIPPSRWPVVLVAALATCYVSKVLLTGARRFLRRQRERVVENAARRLALGLPAFKQARGRDLVDLLMADPAVLEAVEEHSREHEEPRAVMRRAERYALEIVPSFSPYLYFRVGLPLAGLVSRALYRLGSEGGQVVGGDATVVFVMNHRSNLDYVILAHFTRNLAALSFAAGEWARAWPVGWFVRAMGSFFVRRGSGDVSTAACWSGSCRWRLRVV